MDPNTIKKDFPIFQKLPELVYLDSTATSLKPSVVIQKEQEYYTEYTSNVYRGIYEIAEKATIEYEATRAAVAMFLHIPDPTEIIFTRGTTESINLVAATMGEMIVQEGDIIVGTLMDHHSNFVPWQQLALRKKAEWKLIQFDNDHLLKIEMLDTLITPKTKILAFSAISNSFGTINPVKEIVKKAKQLNPDIIVVVDAAQAAPQTGINVQDWGADFVAFSAHKMLGPSGVGVLWAKKQHLEAMPPYQFGGEMVLDVGNLTTTFKESPHKFEAGTPNIAGVIAFKEAITYLEKLGFENIQKHERKLRTYAISRLRESFPDIHILGENLPEKRCGIISFFFDEYHSHDVAQILDESHIAVRAGHHCTMPLHKTLQLGSTTRLSLYIYNTEKDIDAFVEGLKKVATTLQ